MGTALVVIVVAVVIAIAIGAYVRSRRPAAVTAGSERAALGGPSPPPPSDVRTLKPGDVVNYEGGDYIVEGTVRLEQGSFEWQEHRLVDGGRSLWLSVEDDEGLEVVVWERKTGLELEPGAGTLAHDGVDYELDERGQARFTATGSTGTGPSGQMEYVDYEAGERRLSFERYGTDAGWEVAVGHVISEHVLDIYPSRG